ncbi:MAG: sulfotransferase domain-containing protein [Methylococcales bacterium]
MLNKYEAKRYFRYAKKKIRVSLHGCRPTAIYGRVAVSPILLNSIPKAGTHLLENALENFPCIRNAGKRTVHFWGEPDAGVLTSVSSIGRGSFLNAHLPAHPDIFKIVAENKIKVLFVIRDPRDIVLSHFNYVTKIDPSHHLYNLYSGMKDDDERLLASISGVGDIRPSIGVVLREFEPWINNDQVFVCRFEDLIGPDGGGSSEVQNKLILSIANYLEIQLDDSIINRISEKTFSTKSSTFRKGRAGGWRKAFKDVHVDAFKKAAGDELIRYGYEKNFDW